MVRDTRKKERVVISEVELEVFKLYHYSRFSVDLL